MNMKKISLDRRRVTVALLCLLVAATVCFIFWNSFQSREESGEMSHGITAFLRSVFDPNGRIDPDVFHTFVRKLAHFTEFGLLGAELALLRYILCGRLLGVGSFSVAFALLAVANTDEFIQSFTGRGSLVSDVLIDFSGGAVGAAAMLIIIHTVLRLRARSAESSAPVRDRK